MKAPALSMASPLAGRLLREGATLVSDVPCEAVVHVDQAYLSHHGPDQNYRPYLRLSGELRGLVPEQPLPGGVHEVGSRPTMGPVFDVFYEFSDEQLGQMVSKGYFSRQFAVPPIMTGADYELPVTANVLVLEPGDPQAGDVPLVFVDVHNRTGLELDLGSSGYDLADYFESVRQDERQSGELDAEMVDQYDSRAVDDIFNDPRFAGMREAEAQRLAEMEAEEARRAEAQASREGELDEEPQDDLGEGDQPEEPKMSLDQLYEQFVRPYVEGRVAGQPDVQEVTDEEPQAEEPGAEPEPETDDEIDFNNEVDFDAVPDEELGPEPISMGEASVSPSAAQRVADRWQDSQDEADADRSRGQIGE